MADPIAARLDELDKRLRALEKGERRTRALEKEILELRALVLRSPVAARGPEPASEPVPPEKPAVRVEPRPVHTEPELAARPARPPAPPPPPPAEPLPAPRRDVDLADLLGARALAWAGGVVTLLGVVFFFVLAVNRGWIGPVERVGLGGLASVLLLAAGLVARHRYGQLHSALAAAGAGIAGLYATLLAAAALYELVPDVVALALAAGIAGAAVAIALAWSAEPLAGLGLIGAMLVPLAVVVDGDGLSVLGTTFVAVMLAATTALALHRRWRGLLVAGALASVPQIAALVVQEGAGAPGRVLVLAAAFWLLYLGAALALELRGGGPRLDSIATALLLASAALAGGAAAVLLEGRARGAATAVAAGTYIVLAAAVRLSNRLLQGSFSPSRDLGRSLATPVERGRAVSSRAADLSALIAAIGLTLGAIALAELLGGATLALAWAAESVLLAWLAGRIREPRYGLAALAYLGLAAAHALVFEARPVDLFVETSDPADGALTLLGVGIAALLAGLLARRWHPAEAAQSAAPGRLAIAFARFADHRLVWSVAAIGLGALLVLDAASLGVLEVVGDFDWGHVGVNALWAGLAAAVLLAGVVGRRAQVQLAGLAWFGFTLAKWLMFDLPSLTRESQAYSALSLAGVTLLAGYARELLAESDELGRPGLWLAGVSAPLASFAAAVLPETDNGRGLAFLLAGAVYGALAAGVFGLPAYRDLATLLWSLGLLLGLVASEQLLSGTELVAVWALTAGALAWLGELVAERRLQLGGYVFAGLALGYTLLALASPAELFVVRRDPADGVPALMLALLALVALARFSRPAPAASPDRLDAAIDEFQDRARPYAVWGILATYSVSLGILELSETGGDLKAEFQRGHAGVSAFWGLVGLVALYLGLARGRPALRLAGFALFGVSLAKVFLYDLSTLSSVTRALSFLAVGAVLLLGGFFYQRLSREEPAA